MAFLTLCIFAALSFAARSLQESKNPLKDFCRRWGHQTAQVDGKLYIDGGLVAWNPLSSNPLNYTNTWLIYGDLNTSTQEVGMPQQYANLTKNGNVPSVLGGILWADEVNKCFYQFGGEYQNNPMDFSFWAYDTILDQWNESESRSRSIQRVSFGAGTQIEELGLGYYYGGWMNDRTSPGWAGGPMATSSMVSFDFTDGTFKNSSGPDSMGRAEGSMVYLPASDGGLLVYFGGVEDPHKNGTLVGANMSTIHIYDVSSSKWYTQPAGGTVPASRRQFCAGATWADDHTSYNIYLYGGFGVDQSDVTGFDDAYILSLPSFTWIKAWPADNTTTKFGHGGCSANVVNRDQMLIIGGWFPHSEDCDSPSSWGQHNMNLGFNGPEHAMWDKYNPSLTTYFVPTPVISVVGGGPTGGATLTKPSTWNNPDLAVYFTRIPSFSARTATRSLPTSTATPTGSSSKVNVGAIAGGVVGGLVGLIAILLLVLFCLHRRKKAAKNKEQEHQQASPPPVELATTSPVHEMPSPGGTKYISMQQPDPLAHPAFSGPNSLHSRSPSDNPQTSPYPLQHHSSTPPSTSPYPSPYATEFPQNDMTYPQHNQNPYPAYSDNPNQHATSYDPQAGYSQPSTPHHHQRQFSNPTLPSPSHPPMLSPTQQHHHHSQVYYPPPPEPSTSNRSPAAFSDRIPNSPDGTQYSGDTQTQIPSSTSTTPAHFYAQPVPVRPRFAESGNEGYGGDGRIPVPFARGSTESFGAVSVDSRKRPIRGRFVEVDQL